MMKKSVFGSSFRRIGSDLNRISCCVSDVAPLKGIIRRIGVSSAGREGGGREREEGEREREWKVVERKQILFWYSIIVSGKWKGEETALIDEIMPLVSSNGIGALKNIYRKIRCPRLSGPLSPVHGFAFQHGHYQSRFKKITFSPCISKMQIETLPVYRKPKTMGSRVRALPWSWTRRGWLGYKKFIGSLRLPLMLKFLRQFFFWHLKTPHGTRNTTENFFPYSLLALECYGKNHKLTLILSILLNYPVH